MKKLLGVLVVAVLTGIIGVVPAVAGSGIIPTELSDLSKPAGKTKGFTFGGLGKVVHPYWDEVGMGVKNAAVVANCDAVFENPSKEDVARQVTVMEGFIAQGLDGIVFGASDPGAFDKVVKDALKQDIPVITFDSDAPTSGRLVYIGPNNFRSGYLAGKRMGEILGGKGKVAIQVGSLTALNAKERIAGFKEAIKDTKIEIVVEDVDGEDAQVANAHAEAILSSNPDLDGFYGVYAYNGPAQARAVKAAGKKPGEIKIVCFDALEETVQFINEGYVDAAIDHRQYNFGFFSTMILYSMKVYGINDTLTLLGFDPAKDPQDNILHTPTWVITKVDLAEYGKWHDGIKTAPAAAKKTEGFEFGGLGKVIHPYWDEVGQGVKNAAKVANSKAVFENPSKEDVARQVTVLEGYVSQALDGIVFGASDPGAFDKVVKDALKNGIPVVTFDSDAPSSGRLIYVGPNNSLSGYLLGARMKEIINGQGKIAIQVGSLTALNAKNRIAGFKEAIEGSQIEIVTEDVDQEDAQVANAHSEAILSSNPDLGGLYGVYAYNSPAQARAVQAAGKKPGEIKIVGFDALEETVQFMEQGWVDSVVDHRQYNFGYYAVMILNMMKIYGQEMTMYLLGFDPAVDPKANIIYTPSYLITGDGLPEYKEWHKSVFGK
jgi:ribose transport system substrate-binding protein